MLHNHLHMLSPVLATIRRRVNGNAEDAKCPNVDKNGTRMIQQIKPLPAITVNSFLQTRDSLDDDACGMSRSRVSSTKTTQTIGLRNNNPGNIIKTSIQWKGKISGKNRPVNLLSTTHHDERFEQFDTMHNGVRALSKNLHTYMTVHDIRSVASIIEHWAPRNENDTDKYIEFVAKGIFNNIHRNAGTVNKNILNKPLRPNRKNIEKLVDRIILFENGERLDQTLIRKAVADALS
eukprot:gene4702-5756_t